MADGLLNRIHAGGAEAVARRTQPGRGERQQCERYSRTRLLDVPAGRVEDLRRAAVAPGPGPEGYCAEFQVCLPYRGLFVWHVGGEDVVGDPNQVVFVRGGESYRMQSPRPDGYAELIITPDPELLSELAHVRGQRLSDHVLFARRRCHARPGLQRFRARFQHWAAACADRQGLEAEELLVALLRCALEQNGPREPARGTRTARLIRQTKEFLQAHAFRRILLTDIARAVGASPAYLTDLFTRGEGISLHHYVTQLRLARALVELPHADDLTVLALDIGFSSHSHFTFAFRRAFGCTPSEFRESARRAVRPSPGRA